VSRTASKTPAALAPPTPPDLAVAPELAAIVLLEHALDIAIYALIAEHPTLLDDFAFARDKSPVLSHAATIWRRANSLGDVLRRYRLAVRDASTPAEHDASDDDMPF
jgi:hypothetical protein